MMKWIEERCSDFNPQQPLQIMYGLDSRKELTEEILSHFEGYCGSSRTIGKHLVEDSLVFRYRTREAASDGLAGTEGTFNMCSFWYVENLSRAGDVRKAHFTNWTGNYRRERIFIAIFYPFPQDKCEW